MAITIYKKSNLIYAKAFGLGSPFERKAVLLERLATPCLDEAVSKIKSGGKIGAVEKTKAIEDAGRALRKMREERESSSCSSAKASSVETAVGALIAAAGAVCVAIPGKLASDVGSTLQVLTYIVLGASLLATSAYMLLGQIKAKLGNMKSELYESQVKRVNCLLLELANDELQKSMPTSRRKAT